MASLKGRVFRDLLDGEINHRQARVLLSLIKLGELGDQKAIKALLKYESGSILYMDSWIYMEGLFEYGQTNTRE